MTELCEKTFATTMTSDAFRKLALRTCKLAHWVMIEGRDRIHVPNTAIMSIVFSGPDDRDRFIIAMRFAEEERAIAAPVAKPAAAKAAVRGTAAREFVAA